MRVLKIVAVVPLALFCILALVNFVVSIPFQILQVLVWLLLLLPSVPAMYAIEGTELTMARRVLLGLLSVTLWATIFVLIFRYG